MSQDLPGWKPYDCKAPGCVHYQHVATGVKIYKVCEHWWGDGSSQGPFASAELAAIDALRHAERQREQNAMPSPGVTDVVRLHQQYAEQLAAPAASKPAADAPAPKPADGEPGPEDFAAAHDALKSPSLRLPLDLFCELKEVVASLVHRVRADERKRLEGQLATASKVVKQIESDLAVMRAERDQLRAELEQKTRQLDASQRRAAELERSIHEIVEPGVDGAYAQTVAELNKVRAERDALEAKLREVEAARERWERRYIENASKHVVNAVTNEDLRDAVELAKLERDEARDGFDSLIRAHRAYERAHGPLAALQPDTARDGGGES